MKKLLIIFLTLTITMGASAQLRGHYYAPGVSVGAGFGFYYPLYYPFYPYPPYYPYYGYNRPSRLDDQIQGIRNDYQERIWSVKHNKGLSHKEKRQEIRQLKQERDKAITDARLNYYKRS